MSNYTELPETVNDVLELKELGELDEDAIVCPYCKGTGLDRHLDSDCMTCWGEGSILVE